MENVIKKLDMRIVCDILEEEFNGHMKNVEKICNDIESDEEFNKITFYHDTQNEAYFYESKNEERLLIRLANYITDHSMKFIIEEHGTLSDYGKEIYECRSSKNINFDVKFGSLTISKESFYKTLRIEYLNKQDTIERLVKAKDFFDELDDIEKDCLEFVLEEIMDNIRITINETSIERII